MKQNILFYTFGFLGLTMCLVGAQTDSQPRGEDATIHFHVERHAAHVTPIATPSPSPSVSSTDAASPAGVPVVRNAEPTEPPKMIEAHDDNQVPLPALAKATQFQADIVSVVQGMSVEAHISVDGKNVRSDMSMMGMQTSLVVDAEDKQIFQIIPQTKSIVKLPWSSEVEKLLSPTSVSDGTWTHVAKSEMVEGVSCDVWNVLESSGKMVKVDINSTNGAPVKFAADDGSFSVTWKNYKAGPVDSSLFKKPDDYTEIEAPDSMKNLSPSQLGIHL